MILCWLLSIAAAHQPGLSYASVSEDAVRLTFAEAELVPRFPSLDSRGAAVAIWMSLAVEADNIPCKLGAPTTRLVVGDGVEVSGALSCGPGDVTFIADYLSQFEPGHREYLDANGEPVALLDAVHRSATCRGATWLDVARRFVLLGIEHIWTGYDHLCFLVALLVAARSARDAFGVVTGFTLAHSITLSLAATGIATLPPFVVEPAIAATILFVGVENLWHPPARRRLALTFVLGLVHGFGFAGLLAELGLPGGALATALVSFNVGVELGQACVVAVTLPVMLRLGAHPKWRDLGAPLASIALAGSGAAWLAARVWGALQAG
jgi:hypothetical protein